MNSNPSDIDQLREKFFHRLPDNGVFAIMSCKGKKLAYLEGTKADVIEATFLMDGFWGAINGDIIPVNIIKIDEEIIKEMKIAKGAFDAAAETYKKHPLLGLGLMLLCFFFIGCSRQPSRVIREGEKQKEIELQFYPSGDGTIYVVPEEVK